MPWHEKITDAFGFCSAFCFICAHKMCAYGANRVVLWTISCLIFVLKCRFVIAENSSVRQELESWMVLFKNGRLGVMRWVWVVPVLCGRWCVLEKAWRVWKTSLVCCAFKRFLEPKQALFGLQTSLLWRVRASFLRKKMFYTMENQVFDRFLSLFCEFVLSNIFTIKVRCLSDICLCAIFSFFS